MYICVDCDMLMYTYPHTHAVHICIQLHSIHKSHPAYAHLGLQIFTHQAQTKQGMEYICKANRKNKGPGEGPVSPGRTPGLRSKYSSFELDNRLRAGKFVEWLCLSLYMYIYIYMYMYIYIYIYIGMFVTVLYTHYL